MAKGDKYQRFDRGQKYSSSHDENREISDNCEAFDDAGLILKADDFVVDIDCLDRHQIEALIETFDIKTQTVWTDRGVHFYFKRDKSFTRASGVCALGFKVEYKHYDNRYALTIKRNGEMRKVDNDGVRTPMPKIFKPIKSKRVLLGMCDGDGRNEALYELKRHTARYGGVKKILKFVNDYIFAVPLDQHEFETVARDEVITGEKDGENVIAEIIAKEKRVVKYNGSIYFYDGVSYTNDVDDITRIIYPYCPDQKTRYIDEIIKQLNYKVELVRNTDFKINFKNGYLYDGEFYPYTYRGFTPYYIPQEYHSNAQPVKIVDDYLDQLSGGDQDYKDFILEIFASALVLNREFKRSLSKFFIFVGDGGNGKGTLLQIIEKILGESNISSCSITELCDEKYLNNLAGKLANLGDDIQNEPINKKQMKILKNLSSGDNIQIRYLYENSISMRLNPTLIFTSNHKVKTFDKDYSYKRRVVWCPMYTKPNSIDPRFISKLTTDEALEYWIRLLIEAYKRLYKNGHYTKAQPVESFTEEYHRENDSTIEFVELLEENEIIMKRPPEVYKQYELWCENNGENLQSKSRLREQLANVGYEVVPIHRKDFNGGKTAKVYMKKGSENEL